MSIYREKVIDHYKNPRNFGKLDDPDVKVKESNPLCGDDVELYIKLNPNDGSVTDVKFSGRGCALSIAATSVLTEMISGKKLDELKRLNKKDIMKALELPDPGPARIECLLLPLKALKQGLAEYSSKNPFKRRSEGEAQR
ncbi:MAG: SUF system NifU family Fe-S cluster assembly protein [Nitrososphaerota archaeon]|nr:SUF system NifU family Fe-S cluster assembly protein [Nitrososphaerales archaeon]MCX8191265.1 SUF system NifU family Fe-S cluster assembly protein [Nitrososphaerales archaeon]MDW8045072.1 SUF system NifU family Fe-S cluster assembly protein [Nitrososphaerota archaeon]